MSGILQANENMAFRRGVVRAAGSMTAVQRASAPGVRLVWLDVEKGIAILWIVVFHFFGTYVGDALPSPLAPRYFASFLAACGARGQDQLRTTLGCLLQAPLLGVIRLGFHAVGVFLVLSGFGLAYALGKPGAPAPRWREWYRRRVLRLFPMYWVAHVICLVSPFVARPEPIDYRFVLSLLGDRVYPLNMIFYYLNPAWWYFGLLLQLYVVFPLLHGLLRRLGAARFLIACGLATAACRYLMLNVIPVHGYYVQGAFFGARLWEFALGMALGAQCARDPAALLGRLFGRAALLGAAIVYTLGLYSYATNVSYTATDALIGTGLFVILAHVARWSVVLPSIAAGLAYVGTYSYGLYLVHQPYVIYAAERVRDLGMPAAGLVAVAITALLCAAVIPIERTVNRFAARLLDCPGPSNP